MFVAIIHREMNRHTYEVENFVQHGYIYGKMLLLDGYEIYLTELLCYKWLINKPLMNNINKLGL